MVREIKQTGFSVRITKGRKCNQQEAETGGGQMGEEAERLPGSEGQAPGQSRLMGKPSLVRQSLVMTTHHVLMGVCAKCSEHTGSARARLEQVTVTGYRNVMCACDGARVRQTWGSRPSPSTCCVTMGKLLNLSGLQFSHLERGASNTFM